VVILEMSKFATPTYLSIGDGIISNLNSILPLLNSYLSKLKVPPIKPIPMIHRNPIIMDSYFKITNKYFYDNGPLLASELNTLLKTYLSNMISSIKANDDQRMYDEYADGAVAEPQITPKSQAFKAVASEVPTKLYGGSKRRTRKLDMKKRR